MLTWPGSCPMTSGLLRRLGSLTEQTFKGPCLCKTLENSRQMKYGPYAHSVMGKTSSSDQVNWNVKDLCKMQTQVIMGNSPRLEGQKSSPGKGMVQLHVSEWIGVNQDEKRAQGIKSGGGTISWGVKLHDVSWHWQASLVEAKRQSGR